LSAAPAIQSARSIAAAVADGPASAKDVVQESLDRADAARAGRDGLNLLLWRDDAAARRSAREAKPGVLQGVPVVLKDNISTTELPTTCGSKILEGYVAPYEATAVRRLRDAGAIIVAKTNMDEFAMGGSTENSAYGVVKNPFDPSRVAGGSSGGSTAAVAMDGALAALGSDTGGSIRQPSSFCGVVGLKPTYGRVSRHGLMAMGSSLDVVSPTGRSVEDVETIFNIIKNGPEDYGGKGDRYDSTSVGAVEAEARAAEHKAKDKLTIGIVPELMNLGGIDPAVLENLKQSMERLRSAGCEIKEVSLPHITYSLPV